MNKYNRKLCVVFWILRKGMICKVKELKKGLNLVKKGELVTNDVVACDFGEWILLILRIELAPNFLKKENSRPRDAHSDMHHKNF